MNEINCGVVDYKNGIPYKAYFHCNYCLVPNESSILNCNSNCLNLQCTTCGEYSKVFIKGEELVCYD